MYPCNVLVRTGSNLMFCSNVKASSLSTNLTIPSVVVTFFSKAISLKYCNSNLNT